MAEQTLAVYKGFRQQVVHPLLITVLYFCTLCRQSTKLPGAVAYQAALVKTDTLPGTP